MRSLSGRETFSSCEPSTTSASSEDMALVAAVLRKDRKATTEFVARCADDVYRYIHVRLAPHYDQVEDLVQEVFLAAWKALPQFRGAASLVTWVMGIARHKVEDYYRQRMRVPESLEGSSAAAAEIANMPDFHEVLDREQRQKATARVMQQLPEHYRLALRWRYWDKVSAREMAIKTGKTEKAIERLLARARAEFRERWNCG